MTDINRDIDIIRVRIVLLLSILNIWAGDRYIIYLPRNIGSSPIFLFYPLQLISSLSSLRIISDIEMQFSV